MVPLLTYAVTCKPNKEEIEMAISIADRQKSLVLVAFTEGNRCLDLANSHTVLVHPGDTFQDIVNFHSDLA